jgi:ribosome-associated toxin RatA of RatAB toxin-antitoxin module
VIGAFALSLFLTTSANSNTNNTSNSTEGSSQNSPAENTSFDFVKKASNKLDILVLPANGNVRGVEAVKLLDVSFESILKTVTDYNKFDKYMPNVEKSKIVKKSKKEILVDTELDFGLFGVEYVLKMNEVIAPDKSRATISWKRESGEMKVIDGRWLLAAKGSNQVAVKYVSNIDPGVSIPGWIQDMLTKGAVPDLFEAVEERAKKVSSKK